MAKLEQADAIFANWLSYRKQENYTFSTAKKYFRTGDEFRFSEQIEKSVAFPGTDDKFIQQLV